MAVTAWGSVTQAAAAAAEVVLDAEADDVADDDALDEVDELAPVAAGAGEPELQPASAASRVTTTGSASTRLEPVEPVEVREPLKPRGRRPPESARSIGVQMSIVSACP